MTGSPTELELKTHFEDACHYLKSFEQEVCVTYLTIKNDHHSHFT